MTARPSTSSTSSGCASRSVPATTRILAASARAASSVALPPIGMPRLAHVPPPYGVIAVSPDSTLIASIDSASSSPMI